MSWSTGTYTRSNGPTGWQTDAAGGIGIQANLHDAQDNDLATGINTCLTKDGQNTPTANLPMGGFKHTNVGAASALTEYATLGQVQNSASSWLGTVAGGANALTANATPTIGSYVAGQTFRFLPASSNTGPATLNINGLGALTIYRFNGNNLNAGDLAPNYAYEVISNGTQLFLVNPTPTVVPTTASFTPTLTVSAGSLSNVTSSLNAVLRLDRWVDFTCHLQVDLSAVAANITFSMPYNAANAFFTCQGRGNNITAPIAVWGESTGGNVMRLSRVDGANFGTGTNVINVTGTYQAA